MRGGCLGNREGEMEEPIELYLGSHSSRASSIWVHWWEGSDSLELADDSRIVLCARASQYFVVAVALDHRSCYVGDPRGPD